MQRKRVAKKDPEPIRSSYLYTLPRELTDILLKYGLQSSLDIKLVKNRYLHNLVIDITFPGGSALSFEYESLSSKSITSFIYAIMEKRPHVLTMEEDDEEIDVISYDGKNITLHSKFGYIELSDSLSENFTSKMIYIL